MSSALLFHNYGSYRKFARDQSLLRKEQRGSMLSRVSLETLGSCQLCHPSPSRPGFLTESFLRTRALNMATVESSGSGSGTLETGSRSLWMTDFLPTREDLCIYIQQIQPSSGQLYWKKLTPSCMDAMRPFIVDLLPKHYKISLGESFKVSLSQVKTDFLRIRCDNHYHEQMNQVYMNSKEKKIFLANKHYQTVYYHNQARQLCNYTNLCFL